MKEKDIIKEKAARMNDPEVVEEISRIDLAIAAGPGLRSLNRYKTRREIFAARLREIRGGHAE